jgi:hypothetical protein
MPALFVPYPLKATCIESYNGDARIERCEFSFTPQGQMLMAKFAQRHLNLAEVKPEWLVPASATDPRKE